MQTDDLDRARCMAAARRDRIPGQVSFGRDLGLGFDLHMLEILGPQVVVRLDYLVDFSFEKYARARPTRPSDAFAECAEGTALQIWGCLTHAAEDSCIAGALSCPP